MNRTSLKCPHCSTSVVRATRFCPGCQSQLCCGAPFRLYALALVGAIVISAACSAALDAAESWTGWLIGLAILMSCWGLLDWLYADRVRFKRRGARGPDA
ncbi:hypothetical protein R75461_07219 [Paraburkholderia nemoris]|uniref:hypothetical protein n=1 Tax=Paraburkholderia nemoris TaxID=2793076 RepID=UPI00190B2C15|nr:MULTISPECIES: hypothetical protein [Paraburkholderia]MBK3787078.1 hypothetical protein [Paraburkholderia aspalathi]CAE6845241.1 hypothetical protein R75461_07219 [Paraburkholderia nemoris]